MARIPTALIPEPHGKEIPPRDFGLDERVEAAAVLLGTMYPSQVAKRLVSTYKCSYTTAYAYIARARHFIKGLDARDHETTFHDVLHTLRSIRKNPAAADEAKLKAAQLEIGMCGLRREPPAAAKGEPPLFEKDEE
jgi:hypothetical protein